MGLAFMIGGIIVGFWALWVAWKVTKAGGVPPYQDNTTNYPPETAQERFERSAEMTAQEYKAQWPFPGDKP